MSTCGPTVQFMFRRWIEKKLLITTDGNHLLVNYCNGLYSAATYMQLSSEVYIFQLKNSVYIGSSETNSQLELSLFKWRGLPAYSISFSCKAPGQAGGRLNSLQHGIDMNSKSVAGSVMRNTSVTIIGGGTYLLARAHVRDPCSGTLTITFNYCSQP